MNTKAFKSESRRSMSMEIQQCDGTVPDEFIVQFMDADHVLKSFYYKKSDAPKLCLAILEAAGHKGILASEEPGNLIEKAYSAIRLHIKEQERITAEAKERAELEAEALELFSTLQVEIHGILGPNWVNVTEFPNIETKRKWVAVARKSRELGGRAEK